MSYLISVVVPTKNRYKYLKYLITLIDSFKLDELELVIQDNSDNNSEILEYLKQFENENIRYFYTNEKLSMSGNSDKAVLNSTGEYVCFIGDDDGICRNIVDCVKWMKKNNFETLLSRWANYFWGDYCAVGYNYLCQSLTYREPKFSFTSFDPIEELKQSMKKGFQHSRNIPFLYSGIVSRKILDEIFKIGKTFFPGGSPDISNGVCNSLLARRSVKIDFPVIIRGSSQFQGGGINRLKNKISKLEDVKFIERSVIDNWEKNIPRYWATQLAWPESGIKGLRYMGREDMIPLFNYNYMLASFAVHHISLLSTSLKYSKKKPLCLYYFINILFDRLIRNSARYTPVFVRKKFDAVIIKKEIKDIINAEEFLMKSINKMNFENIIVS